MISSLFSALGAVVLNFNIVGFVHYLTLGCFRLPPVTFAITNIHTKVRMKMRANKERYS